MPLENGYLLNHRYRIHEILGQGGMGAVYRATDENLDVTVAIKENAFFSEDYARQFRREAKVLAALRHPNLPRVFDYFVIDQQGQYLVMDYIEGDDLRQWMNKEGVISEIEAVQIGIEICDALIYLHSRVPAITHRDIKPGNIKITPDGEVLLVDFGLVKINYGKEMTTTAARAMTPGYSPPEQYGDTPTDHRSDIFSLGATLYAALAGYLPEDSLARATGKTELTPLRNYNPDVSSKLASIIEKSLALRYKDRWQSAWDFKEALLEVKEAIPKEEWKSDRLIFVEEPKLKPGLDGLDEQRAKKTEENENFLDNVRSKSFTPVWIVLGSILGLMLLILGASLIWPEKFRSVLSRGADPERTITLAVRESETQNSPLGTEEIQGSPGGPSSTPEQVETTSSEAEINPTITPSGGGIGMIAYVSESTGLPQIWLLDVDKGLTYQLTHLDEGACQPDWSPDGKRIVFTSPCPGKRSRYRGSSLFILDINENELTQLTDSLEGDFDPAWSPGGDWIAYTSSINGQLQLYKINTNDSSVVKLSDGAYNDSDPAWSAEGRRLAFIRTRGVDQVWLMDFDGSNPVQFTLSGEIDNSNPCWFSKEDLIIFSQTLGLGSPSKQIFGMRLGDIGKDEEYPITPAAQMDYIPLMDNVDVSPDGSLLAFDYWYFDVLSDIYIMRFPGLDLQQMTDDPAPDYDPVWRSLP